MRWCDVIRMKVYIPVYNRWFLYRVFHFVYLCITGGVLYAVTLMSLLLSDSVLNQVSMYPHSVCSSSLNYMLLNSRVKQLANFSGIKLGNLLKKWKFKDITSFLWK